MKKLIYIIALLLLALPQVAWAQEEIEMADQFRADGKIYVVVAVVTIVLLGLILFAFSIDRKVRRLEKERNA